MKYVNFYNATAAVIIGTLVITMAQATGEFAPPLIVGALFLTVLVMGWAGAASDARAEVDRLKCIMYGQNTEARLRAAEVVKRGAEIVRQRRLITSIQEDNSTWREGCDAQIRRIGELTGANDIAAARIAELEKTVEHHSYDASVWHLAHGVAAGRIARLDAVNALLVNLHTAVVEHVAMFEETSDEYNMSALSIQQALDAIQAAAQIEPNTPQTRMDAGVDAASTPLTGDHINDAVEMVRDHGDTGIPVSVQTTGNPVITPQAGGAPAVDLCAAVGKLIKAKGRFHTEKNYRAVVTAYDAAIAAGKAAA